MAASICRRSRRLRLEGLPARTPGRDFLSVDAGGEVYRGPFDASELPPGSFVVAPESEALQARRAAPRAVPTPTRRGARHVSVSVGGPADGAAGECARCASNAAFPYTGVTLLWADYDSSQSEDLYWGWLRIAVGSSVFIQDKDNHLQYLELETTAAPVDRGGYVEVPVRYVAAGDALAVQDCLVGIGAPAVDGAGWAHGDVCGDVVYGRGAAGRASCR